MKKLSIAAIGVAALALVVTFGSPYIAMYQIRTAIAERDAEAISDHVDFPALRDSLKGQIMGGMMATMETPEMKSNPFAGMGKALGMAMIGPMIDSMISPAGIIALMRHESPAPEKATRASDDTEKPNYKLSFKGWSKVVLHRDDTDSADGALTLRRFGLWDWKLTSIELPGDAFKK